MVPLRMRMSSGWVAEERQAGISALFQHRSSRGSTSSIFSFTRRETCRRGGIAPIASARTLSCSRLPKLECELPPSSHTETHRSRTWRTASDNSARRNRRQTRFNTHTPNRSHPFTLPLLGKTLLTSTHRAAHRTHLTTTSVETIDTKLSAWTVKTMLTFFLIPPTMSRYISERR